MKTLNEPGLSLGSVSGSRRLSGEQSSSRKYPSCERKLQLQGVLTAYGINPTPRNDLTRLGLFHAAEARTTNPASKLSLTATYKDYRIEPV